MRAARRMTPVAPGVRAPGANTGLKGVPNPTTEIAAGTIATTRRTTEEGTQGREAVATMREAGVATVEKQDEEEGEKM